MTMHGGQVIARILEEQNIKYFFGVHGAHVWVLITAICERGINMIHMRHEQAGVYAADAYSRIMRQPGICFGRKKEVLYSIPVHVLHHQWYRCTQDIVASLEYRGVTRKGERQVE